jgi:predicted RND superfamily exporter protein
MIWATLLALLAIGGTLALAFGSLKYGLLSMLVNTMPATIALGIWGILVGQVGLSVSIVFSVSIGIIVDYCVHFMSKYRRARHEQGLPTAEAIEYAFGTVGVALLVTTAVLVVNFGILSLSQFRVNIYMGVLTSMTIALALLTQLFFLPALLLTLTNIKARLAQASPPAVTTEGASPSIMERMRTHCYGKIRAWVLPSVASG